MTRRRRRSRDPGRGAGQQGRLLAAAYRPLRARRVFLFALGGANGNDGPGGIAVLDHNTFDVLGPWERDRGDQFFGYDGWWHLNHDTMITSEWGAPSMVESGLDPEDLLGRRFGHHLNFWSMSERKLVQRVDLGDAHQMVFEVRPAHDPTKAHPAVPDLPLSGGPQMVELSRDGQRVYVTNSLYGAWDPVFYPDGVGVWMAKLDANTDGGGINPDPRFFPNGDDFRGCECTRPPGWRGRLQRLVLLHRMTTAASRTPSDIDRE